jgi:hypothetical protein
MQDEATTICKMLEFLVRVGCFQISKTQLSSGFWFCLLPSKWTDQCPRLGSQEGIV